MATKLPPGIVITAWLLLAVSGATAGAGEIQVQVTDDGGKPAANVAVVVHALGEHPALPSDNEEVVDQVDREFVPSAITVPVGTEIMFPNGDDIRHHVYSFSEAKSFELPLYTGMPARPIAFPNPGIVTIGCNIHDWMRAHIYVVDSPWHGLTDDNGAWKVAGMPTGRYEVELWHHGLPEEQQTVADVDLDANGSVAVEATVELATGPAPRRAPRPGRQRYR